MIDSGAIPGFPGLVGSRSQDESAAALETRLREVSFSAEVWYVLMVIDGQSLNPRKRADIRAVREPQLQGESLFTTLVSDSGHNSTDESVEARPQALEREKD